MSEIGEFGASGAFWFWWMNYHSLMVFSMSEMVSSISSSVSLLSSILVNVRLKIVIISSSLVIHEVNVFLTVRILVSYLDRRLLIWFNIHFLMMYLIMVEFPLLSYLQWMTRNDECDELVDCRNVEEQTSHYYSTTITLIQWKNKIFNTNKRRSSVIIS